MKRPASPRSSSKPYASRKPTALEKVGRGISDTRLTDDAPYTRKLPSWPIFFHAPDPELHATLPPDIWNPSSFDGASSL
jgi:hypothetical protein